jgi:hypothetical protein
VPRAGLEPARLAAQDPKSCVAASYTTRPGFTPLYAIRRGRQRPSIPHVSRVILDVVSIQELQELLLKRDRAVMFLLIGNVPSDRFQVRFADAECTVSGLPRIVGSGRPDFVDPPGRVGLYDAHDLGDRPGCGQNQKEMGVVNDGVARDLIHAEF